MGGAEFTNWLTETGLSRRVAAQRLGLCKRTVIRYSRGQTQVPRIVELACLAVKENLDMSSDYSKLIPMQKRRAMGEYITGQKKDAQGAPMKKGGAAKKAGYKKGGKSC